MNKKLFFGALNAIALFSAPALMGQNFQTMPVQSGYTADVIANGVGSSSLSTSTDVDGVSFAFVAKDFQLTSTSTPLTYGIPADGIINSVVTGTPGLSYALGSLSANNSLRLAGVNDSGTLTFTTPKAAFTLYMLSTSGSGTSAVDVVVKFTDNTTQTFSNVSLSDWYNGSNYAIQGIGRINRTNDVLESSTTNPRLYQSALAIDAANQSKPIQSVTVTKISGSGIPNIFAFSADAYSDCVPPTLDPVTNITQNSAQLSWTSPAGAQVASYDVYYSTSSTPPTNSMPATIPAVVGTTTSTGNVLAANTTYYYWVRANCNTATSQSVWSFSGTFKTLCGPMTSMSENFDSYGTGNIVPDCWVRLAGTGSQTITSTTPASGTRNIYQYASSSQTPTIVVLPIFSNVNAGTNWLRFKARVSSGAPGSLDVGYVTDVADASTFVSLQTLTINNTSYTAANSEYTVIVPSSVPANARLAIKNAADSKSYYWDDVYWEQTPTCFAPTLVTPSNVSSSSATIGWTAPAATPANGYEVYYSTSSTAPAANVVLDATNSTTSATTSAPLSGLASATTYYAWVRSSCSATDKSAWSTSATFTTACVSTNVPYTLDFESVTVPNLPVCGTNVNMGSGNNWITANAPSDSPGFTTKVLKYSYNSSSAANTWFFTQGLNLTAGTPYKISYMYGNNSTTYVEKMKVAFGTSADAAAMVNPIADYSSINDKTAHTESITFTVPVSGVYYFGFNAYSDADQYYLYVDDINIVDTSLATSEVSANRKTIQMYPNPFTDVLNISDIKNVKSISVVDVTGRLVKTFDKPVSTLHLGDLNEGVYLVVLTMNDGSKQTIKAVKK